MAEKVYTWKHHNNKTSYTPK